MTYEEAIKVPGAKIDSYGVTVINPDNGCLYRYSNQRPERIAESTMYERELSDLALNQDE